MSTNLTDWLCVHRDKSLAEMQELAFVLTALGIDHWLRPDGDEYELLVPANQADQAYLELTEYVAERQAWPPPEPPMPAISADLRDGAGYWLVLLGVFLCQQSEAFGADWLEAGKLQAGLIVRGQWWRTATALTLHADGPHLFGNLLFGTLFGLLLTQELGRGLAWLSILLAGAVGNALNAWIQPAGHTSVGASTAVFAAIAMTMVLQWHHHAGRGWLLQRWTPIIIGLVFLGFLGTAGPRTDVMAHVLGLVSGMAGGGILHTQRRHLPSLKVLQKWFGMTALLLLAGAWLLALHTVR